MDCQVCKSQMRDAFRKRGYLICECPACGHQSANIDVSANHVEQVYGDDYFMGGGAGYIDYVSEGHLLVSHGKRYAELLARHMPPGRVLDAGAAAGFLLKAFVDSGWTGRGIEPNVGMSAYARERLGLQVETGTLESWPHSDERFDLIKMVQVVGHFVELNHAFEKAARATLPNGYWLIESWNRASWTARITGKWWHEYSPPSVLHWFTPDTLKNLAAQFGFHEVARGRPLKRLNGAHAASLLSYKLTAGNLKIGRLAAKATKLIPPNASLPYPAEDLFWMLLRRSGDFH